MKKKYCISNVTNIVIKNKIFLKTEDLSDKLDIRNPTLQMLEI